MRLIKAGKPVNDEEIELLLESKNLDVFKEVVSEWPILFLFYFWHLRYVFILNLA